MSSEIGKIEKRAPVPQVSPATTSNPLLGTTNRQLLLAQLRIPGCVGSTKERTDERMPSAPTMISDSKESPDDVVTTAGNAEPPPCTPMTELWNLTDPAGRAECNALSRSALRRARMPTPKRDSTKSRSVFANHLPRGFRIPPCSWTTEQARTLSPMPIASRPSSPLGVSPMPPPEARSSAPRSSTVTSQPFR